VRVPRSIVFRTAIYAAGLCALVCIVIFVVLFQMQRRIYEQRLEKEAEENIVRTSQSFLGYFYAQNNWVYLEDQQSTFNKAPNILYNYVVNAKGNIDLGIHGFQSAEIGKMRQTWEPDLNDPAPSYTLRIPFTANDELIRAYPDRVSAGDKLVLISAPIWCLTTKEVCGHLRVGIVFETMSATLSQLRISLVISAAILTLCIFSLVYLTARRSLMPIKEISEKMRDLARESSGANSATPTVSVSEELYTDQNEDEETRFFRESLQQFTTAYQRTSALENELRLSRSLSDLAAQVAHDIRSPLAALEIVSSSLSQLPEDRRILLRSALARIRDIANNLLSGNQPHIRWNRGQSLAPSEFEASLTDEMSVYLLASLVDGLLSEKRIQFRVRMGVEIVGALDSPSYGLFVRVPAVQFKRVLSNIINNAVEAIDGQGTVSVMAEARDGFARVRVRDTGKGIPPELLPKLTDKGFSHGKAGGLGLGLFHAKTAVDAWGGNISIGSLEGGGTEVEISLPLQRPPEWFVSELSIRPGSTVVVVDDDSSIHQVWQSRLETLREATVNVRHFTMPEEYMRWHAENAVSTENKLYLIDFEFIGSEITGLDIVKKLNIAHSTVLVTSRFEEPHVVNECVRLGIRLIPKGQAGFVPIRVRAEINRPHAILIDDDPLVRDGWKLRAKNRGKEIIAFGSIAEFRAVWASYDKETPVFVDSMLGTEIRGEDFALELYGNGFRKLYLATGYPASSFEPMAWLTGIVSKEPPDWLF